MAEQCRYQLGEEVLHGPIAICNSYEQNMLEGRAKLDELVWGEATVEALADDAFYIHFTDYLTHKGQQHIHRCKQRVEVGADGKIHCIEHIHNVQEQAKLDAFYVSVGLK